MEETHHILARYNVTHPTDAERCLASEIATLLLLRQGDKQALALARAEVEAVEAACFEMCPDNTRRVFGGFGPDPEEARFVCCGENGDPIIEADTPADVVRQMAACWTALGERYDRLAAALAAARAENEKLREALAHYANAVNWMSHTDADAMLRVWIGSGDGPDYARRALAAQEGTR